MHVQERQVLWLNVITVSYNFFLFFLIFKDIQKDDYIAQKNQIDIQ